MTLSWLSFPLLPASLATTLATLSAAALALRARFHHCQRDTLPLLIDTHDPDRHHIAHADHVVRRLDVSIGELTDVNETRVLQADIHERAEIDHVKHGAFQLHAGGQILELEDALFEDRLGKIVARVAFRSAKGLDDISERELTDLQLFRKLR